ncbi:hypothetical protein LEP1GSC047_1327 [Leptospira inadai serovar Lyme str. 10]|uniref:Uncharacterized protein n=2 Tax=Leptospira inadai serovar Lyme TaxID=293084 RepID=V6HAC4_9LEPT|nr:hypothetical protein LEP1GSC047_1327 [Leptospira inadai serovar Lyme str. 10]PNV76050.1 hypothetical protein BES34_005995 [Leptospira inadai serovar Lyme]
MSLFDLKQPCSSIPNRSFKFSLIHFSASIQTIYIQIAGFDHLQDENFACRFIKKSQGRGRDKSLPLT